MATRLHERGRVTEGRPAPDEAYLEPLVSYTRWLGWHLGELFTRGAVAGIAAGFVFLLANMAYATSEGKPSLAPFMDISTIFHGTDRPASMTPTLDTLATSRAAWSPRFAQQLVLADGGLEALKCVERSSS